MPNAKEIETTEFSAPDENFTSDHVGCGSIWYGNYASPASFEPATPAYRGVGISSKISLGSWLREALRRLHRGGERSSGHPSAVGANAILDDKKSTIAGDSIIIASADILNPKPAWVCRLQDGPGVQRSIRNALILPLPTRCITQGNGRMLPARWSRTWSNSSDREVLSGYLESG